MSDEKTPDGRRSLPRPGGTYLSARGTTYVVRSGREIDGQTDIVVSTPWEKGHPYAFSGREEWETWTRLDRAGGQPVEWDAPLTPEMEKAAEENKRTALLEAALGKPPSDEKTGPQATDSLLDPISPGDLAVWLEAASRHARSQRPETLPAAVELALSLLADAHSDDDRRLILMDLAMDGAASGRKSAAMGSVALPKVTEIVGRLFGRSLAEVLESQRKTSPPGLSTICDPCFQSLQPLEEKTPGRAAGFLRECELCGNPVPNETMHLIPVAKGGGK